MTAPARKRLGELLVEAGIIDQTALTSALAYQRQWGIRLGQAVVDLKMAAEADIVRVLAKRFGFEVAKLEELEAYAHGQAIGLVPQDFAVKNNVFPLAADSTTLAVAMSDPTNLAVVDELRFRTGRRVKVSIGGDHEIAAAVAAAYSSADGGVESIALDVDDGDELAAPGATVSDGFGGGSSEDFDSFFGADGDTHAADGLGGAPNPFAAGAAPVPADPFAAPPVEAADPLPNPFAAPRPAAPVPAPAPARAPAAPVPAGPAPARPAPGAVSSPVAPQAPRAPAPAAPVAPAPLGGGRPPVPAPRPGAPAPGAPRPGAPAPGAPGPGALNPGALRPGAPAPGLAPRPAPAPAPRPGASAAASISAPGAAAVPVLARPGPGAPLPGAPLPPPPGVAGRAPAAPVRPVIPSGPGAPRAPGPRPAAPPPAAGPGPGRGPSAPLPPAAAPRPAPPAAPAAIPPAPAPAATLKSAAPARATGPGAELDLELDAQPSDALDEARAVRRAMRDPLAPAVPAGPLPALPPVEPEEELTPLPEEGDPSADPAPATAAGQPAPAPVIHPAAPPPAVPPAADPPPAAPAAPPPAGSPGSAQGDDSLLDAVKRLAAGDPADPALLDPRRALAGLIQLLLRKGVIDEDELLETLRRDEG